MDTIPYTTRSLVAADYDEFERISQQPRAIFDTWIGEANAGVRVTVIAEVDGQIVGMVSAHAYRRELEDGGFHFDLSGAVVEDVNIDDAVHAALLRLVEVEIRDKGFTQLMLRVSKRAAGQMTADGWSVGRSGFGFVWEERFGDCRFAFANGSGADNVAIKIFKPGELVGTWYREPSDHRDFMKRVTNSDRAMRDAYPK